jgi:predicted ATP-grasp superfamily ATP-dependent carboligase
LLDQLSAPDTTPHLDFYICCSEDGLNFGRVVAVSSNSVEVYDVKMPKPILSPGGGNSYRIRDPKKLLVIGSGGKLDTRSCAKIESGYGDHW